MKSYSDIFLQLAMARGLNSIEEIERQNTFKYGEHIHAPESIAGMSEAVTMLYANIKEGNILLTVLKAVSLKDSSGINAFKLFPVSSKPSKPCSLNKATNCSDWLVSVVSKSKDM